MYQEPFSCYPGNRFMKRKIKYTDEPLSNVRVVEDFLPPPKNLVLRRKRPMAAHKTTRRVRHRTT